MEGTLRKLALYSLCLVAHGCAAQRRAPAQSAPAACPEIRGNVVVIGGRGAQTKDMAACYPDFLALSPEDGSRLAACLAGDIERNADRNYLIVGHSSGTAPAESLARSLSNKEHARLILLEGYSMPLRQTGVKGACWYAENKVKKIKGFNAGAMLDSNVCPQPANAFEAAWCENSLCLHVANVNLNVPADITPKDVFTRGLANCRGNTAWMTEELRAWLKN